MCDDVVDLETDIPVPPPVATALTVLAVMGLLACSPFGEVTDEDRDWVEEYARATSHEPHRAVEILERLTSTAPTDEKRRDAEFDLARMALKADDLETATGAFQSLVDEQVDDRIDSRARYELGRLAAEHHGDHDRARQLLEEAILETTPWAGSELALKFYVRHERDLQRHEQLVDALADLADDTDDDRMAAQLHLERGMVLDDDLRRTDDALDAFRAAFDRCYDCASTDEALYQMGNVYVRLQQWQPAIEVLEIVADRTDRSRFVGTYSSARASDARYLLGRIEMLYRQDYEAARYHFEEYLDWFGDGPDGHHVAWYLVDIERLDGTDESYRDALRQFIEDHPYSRHVDTAEDRLEQFS